MKYNFNIKDKQRFVVIVIVSLLFCVSVIVAYAEITMLSSNEHIVDTFDQLPEHQVGVVFGGGMDAPGIQSQDQKDRVTLGIDLYKKSIVQTLLLTGDDGSFRANETEYMRAQAVYGGVPLYIVEVDGKGFRTFESCKRLKEEYNYTKVIAVSQRYHLKRIIYLCSQVGVEVTGIAADDYLDKKAVSHFREPFARVKGIIDVIIYNF